ncbi:flocculin [Saccharomycopsis crataegensis]|uniref:Flocculin n=1 Tax=Saccharomycopsis crataegensis TaxID=43959 RepID=A0AAV5QGR1_9ASCO|nr:flocculin [Saccharomycopsis crataegensis]
MILIWLLTTIALLISNVAADSLSCLPKGYGNTGFTGRFYQYPYGSTEHESAEFMNEGYKQYAFLGEKTGVEDIDIFIPPEYAEGQTLEVYGFDTNINFTVELTGYFFPEETGDYDFALQVDDGGLVAFGSDQAFSCCNSLNSSADDGYTLFASYATSSNLEGETSATKHLAAGLYYPLRVVWTNRGGQGRLNFTMTTPSGKEITTFDSVLSFPNVTSYCPYTTTSLTTTQPWTGTFTSTYTTETTVSGTTVPQVVVETPGSTVTTTQPWTGTFTSTYTTETTVSGTTVPQVIVETPGSTVSTTRFITNVEFTTIITITSCFENKCQKSVVSATPTVSTETVNGKTTVYTTYCPVSQTEEFVSQKTSSTPVFSYDASTIPTTPISSSILSTASSIDLSTSSVSISIYEASGVILNPLLLLLLVPFSLIM